MGRRFDDARKERGGGGKEIALIQKLGENDCGLC